MISSEVQRTLVKSPPELWAELSDPTSLARHLGELGEIKITRIEPEKTVEWEAADTTGKVLLKPSGWGTKVTLSAAREISAPEPVPEAPVQEPELAIEARVEPEPAIEVEPEPMAVEEPEPEVVLEEPEPRPGFFARLFRRRVKEQAAPEPSLDEPRVEPATEPEPKPELAIEPESEPAIEPKPELAIEPEPAPEDVTKPDEPPEDTPDIAAELQAAEEAATEEVTAVLTAALDRLGAAHHRPFSRS
jgi:hypothetical protein